VNWRLNKNSADSRANISLSLDTGNRSLVRFFYKTFFFFFRTLTGYIPQHTVRFVLYCSAFGVDIPKDSLTYWRCRFFNPPGVHIVITQ